MAKKDKELVAGVESKWDGRLLTLIGTGLLQILVFGIFAVIGAVVAAFNIYHKGSDLLTDLQNPVNLILVIVGAAIVGFGFCWAVIIGIKWDTKHTVVSGQRLQFTAGTLNLFFNCIKWLFLTVITIGIYSFWLSIKVRQWKAKYTVSYPEIEEEEEVNYVEYPITYYEVDEDGNYEEYEVEEDEE